MRIISINGAVFIFLKPGEKLKDNEGLPLNGYPDRRYVLWPTQTGWDVRVKIYHERGMSWHPIARNKFLDENVAWQTAYAHMMAKRN